MTSSNHAEVLNGADKVDSISAVLDGLDKKQVRSVLKACKEKLNENGKITVKGIKNKNALILAGFTNVTGDSSAFTGVIKTFQPVSLDLGNSESSAPIDPESLLKAEDKIKPNTPIFHKILKKFKTKRLRNFFKNSQN